MKKEYITSKMTTKKKKPTECEDCKKKIEKGRESYFGGKILCQRCWRQEKNKHKYCTKDKRCKKNWLDNLIKKQK